MKLKKLEITGFKSFHDKTSITFQAGISAIVGPNGCGKSNVVDAIRWVMGEQSLKQLRGKSREDIIFSGAAGIAPLNIAEVNLILANDNGSAPEELRDFSEIQITRRLFRSGESNYLLNKQPCRLKDIYNVFLGSGMGAKSYAVIQQGNIGAITEAGPEERRQFIEEAAGTTRYKTRKVEALRKIRATRQNLLRLDDILVEINRQINGLKRQARKAERFRKYRDRLRGLEIRLGIMRYDQLSVEINSAQDLLSGLRDTDMAHTSRLKQVDAAVEEIKLQRWQKEEQISARRSKIFETRRSADRLENDLAHTQSEIQRLEEEIRALETARVDLTEKITDLSSEIEIGQSQAVSLQQEVDGARKSIEREQEASGHLRSRLADLSTRRDDEKTGLMQLIAQEARIKNIYQNASSNSENIRRRLTRKDEEEVLAGKQSSTCMQKLDQCRDRLETLQAALGKVTGEIQGAEKTLNDRRAELAAQVKKTQGLEYAKNQIESQYVALKKMEANYEWYQDGVKAIMKQWPESPGRNGPGPTDSPADQPDALAACGIQGLMVDIIDVDPDYETAVEAVLGESLQYVLVSDQETAGQAIAFLRENTAGRSGFIPVSLLKPDQNSSVLKGTTCEPLLDHIAIQSGYEPIVHALLGDAVVADSLAKALDIFHQNGVRQTLVTRDGDLVSPRGVMVGGSKEPLSGILGKKKEIQTLKGELDALKTKLASALQTQAQMETQLREAESQLQQRIARRQELQQDAVDAEKATYKAEQEAKSAQRHLEIVQLEQEQLLGEADDASAEMAHYHDALEKITTEVQEAQQAVAEIGAEIDTLTTSLQTFDQRLVDLKLAHTRFGAQLDNNANTLRRLREFQGDAVTRQGQLERDIAAKNQKLGLSAEKTDGTRRTLEQMYDDIRRLEQALERQEQDYHGFDQRLKENEAVIIDLRQQREETTEKIRLLELEQSQQRMRQDNIVQRLSERYHKSLPALRQEVAAAQSEQPPSTGLSADRLENDIEQLQRKIERIGDVNLGAISEYEEHKQRHDFLTDQRADLVQAVDDLQKVIRKINRITQKRFLETLAAINDKLEQVFPRLFEGGSAKLVLTEPDNPLESGVEFMAHPPGKKLTRMSLLSGGEKALSAIAFIFAIFLIKPASFCLLDEIDAPLDEANIFRFNELLKLIGENSQIVMITHNKRTMEFADTLFGITMEKKGISKVVSVSLN